MPLSILAPKGFVIITNVKFHEQADKVRGVYVVNVSQSINDQPKGCFVAKEIVHVAIFQGVSPHVARGRFDPARQIVLRIVVRPTVIITAVLYDLLKHGLHVTGICNELM